MIAGKVDFPFVQVCVRLCTKLYENVRLGRFMYV